MEEARPAERSVTLHRQEEPLRAVSTLTLRPDGTITLHSFDTASAFWGGGDYEFWIAVPPDAHAELVAILLRELKPPPPSGEVGGGAAAVLPDQLFALLEMKYTGEAQAVSDLTALCKREGIAHKFDSRVTYAKG